MLILVLLAALLGPPDESLVLLPLVPAAVLVGAWFAAMPWGLDDYRLAPASWGAIGAALLLPLGLILVAAFFVFDPAQRANASQTPVAVAALFLVGSAVGVAGLWRDAPAEQRRRSLVVLGTICLLVLTASGVARLVFGGSPIGSEPLYSEITDQSVRKVFKEQTILANADKRVLIVDRATPMVVRWYGRSIEQVRTRPAAAGGAIVVSTAELGRGESQGPAIPGRTPWKTEANLDSRDLNPLGVARWAVSRLGLIDRKWVDIIIAQQS